VRRFNRIAVSALVALSSLTGALALAGPAGATTPAPQADVVSPTASWPLGNCLAGCGQGTTAGQVALINYARSLEGIGPIYLPSDYSSLPADAQTLFIVNEERIGRGLPPFDGTTAYQNSLALSNATPSPTLPNGGGSAWAPTGSVLTADYEWMYNDGIGAATCPYATATGCWAQRDAILASYPAPTSGTNAGTVTMGAGYDGTSTYDTGMSAVFSAGGSNPNQPYATSWASITPTIPTSAPTPVPTSASTMLGGSGTVICKVGVGSRADRG